MFNSIYEFTLKIYHNQTVMLWLYWMPFTACMIDAVAENIYSAIKEHRAYKAAIEKDDWFHPQLTIGSILGSLILPFLPIVNFLYTVFSVSPRAGSELRKHLGGVFSYKLFKEHTPSRVTNLTKG